MVAIVSGNSLGLSLTSMATLGQRGLFGTATQGQSGERAYVNIANGNLVLQDLDDQLVSQGEDIAALRTYNSQGLMDDDNADNWTTGASRLGNLHYARAGTLNTAGSTLTLVGPDGSRALYTWDGSLYRCTDGAGAYDTIAYDKRTRTFTRTDGDTGTTETYRRIGSKDGKDVVAMMSRADVHGNRTSYTYDAAGRLSYYEMNVRTGVAHTNRYRYSYADYDSSQVDQIIGYRWDGQNEQELAELRARSFHLSNTVQMAGHYCPPWNQHGTGVTEPPGSRFRRVRAADSNTNWRRTVDTDGFRHVNSNWGAARLFALRSDDCRRSKPGARAASRTCASHGGCPAVARPATGLRWPARGSPAAFAARRRCASGAAAGSRPRGAAGGQPRRRIAG